MMKDAFALAVLSFIICKLSFSLLSWFVDEKKTPFHWQQTQQSYHHLLHRFVQRIKESFFSQPSALFPLVGASLLYHLLSFFLAIELLAFLESIFFQIPYEAGDGLWQFIYLDPHDRLWPWWLYVLASVCGVGFDVLSAWLTLALLKKADHAKYPTSLARLLGLLLVHSFAPTRHLSRSEPLSINHSGGHTSQSNRLHGRCVDLYPGHKRQRPYLELLQPWSFHVGHPVASPWVSHLALYTIHPHEHKQNNNLSKSAASPKTGNDSRNIECDTRGCTQDFFVSKASMLWNAAF